jgi:hypothetical protein
MTKLKRYHVSASVTISLHQYVFARSKKDAIEKASALGMPSISNPDDWNYRPPTDPEDEPDEWRTSGELDGEAVGLTAELEDPGGGDHG